MRYSFEECLKLWYEMGYNSIECTIPELVRIFRSFSTEQQLQLNEVYFKAQKDYIINNIDFENVKRDHVV